MRSTPPGLHDQARWLGLAAVQSMRGTPGPGSPAQRTASMECLAARAPAVVGCRVGCGEAALGHLAYREKGSGSSSMYPNVHPHGNLMGNLGLLHAGNDCVH